MKQLAEQMAERLVRIGLVDIIDRYAVENEIFEMLRDDWIETEGL